MKHFSKLQHNCLHRSKTTKVFCYILLALQSIFFVCNYFKEKHVKHKLIYYFVPTIKNRYDCEEVLTGLYLDWSGLWYFGGFYRPQVYLMKVIVVNYHFVVVLERKKTVVLSSKAFQVDEWFSLIMSYEVVLVTALYSTVNTIQFTLFFAILITYTPTTTIPPGVYQKLLHIVMWSHFVSSMAMHLH